jgi:ParB-like chromosome segregation protein Spo0J
MEIQLKDLYPNPFKGHINGGKLNGGKIERLKESIQKDGFWDNILCRKVNGNYELAYGHHRIEAAKQLLGKDYVVDIPCKNLSDEAMLRILGNENNFQNEELVIYQIDQVLATKEFLEKNPQISKQWKSEQSDGHGQKPGDVISISKFLGEQNWSKSKVADLLKMHENLHPEVLAEVRNAGNKGNDHNVISKTHALHLSQIKDKKKQKQVAERVKNEGLTERETKKEVDRVILGDKFKKTYREKPDINGVLNELAKSLNRATILLNDCVIQNWDSASESVKKDVLLQFNLLFKRLGEIKDDKARMLKEGDR